MIPVFILGISPRCGTNYLAGLLTLHSDCIGTRLKGEDFIIYNSNKYLDFVNTVRFYAAGWHNDPQLLSTCLENGLIEYLTPPGAEGKYVITKTPQPFGASNFQSMFSNGYMILLVRRGQDITESFRKSFNSRFDDAVRAFSYGAKGIIAALEDAELMQSGRVKLVKYEDLFAENRKTMADILEFLNLDESGFDFEKSASFDVIGSSQSVDKIGKVTWNPIKKEKTFNPVRRSDNWTRWQHYRFNWIAGKYSRKLDYPLEYPEKSLLYYSYNLIAMVSDLTIRILRKINQKLRQFAGLPIKKKQS